MIRDCHFVLYTSPVLPNFFLQPCSCSLCSGQFLTRPSVSFATYISNVVIFYHHVPLLSGLRGNYTCPANRVASTLGGLSEMRLRMGLRHERPLFAGPLFNSGCSAFGRNLTLNLTSSLTSQQDPYLRWPFNLLSALH